ncbi:hypothetical protein CPC08DRAFT_705239, partial [Agrocybe pediades]
MKFAISSTLLTLAAGLASAATIESRLSCPQATRFGIVTLSKSTVKAGDSLTINVDLRCAVQNFGINAQFLDYTLEVPASSNNGFQAPIVLGRHSIAHGALSDTLTTTIPHGFFVAGSNYNVVL